MSDPDSPIQPTPAPAEDSSPVPAASPQHAATGDPAPVQPPVAEVPEIPEVLEVPEAPETAPAFETAEVVAVPVQPEPRIVYLEAPVPPKPRGNRGFGSVLALLSAVAYALLFAVAVVIVFYFFTGRMTLDFVGQPNFFVPVLYFALGSVLLVLILNRANWWAYVIGSIFVAILVYFGTIGTLLLGGGIVLMTPEEAASAFAKALRNPIVIAAALIAREVALWAGAGISARGRRIRADNLEERAAFDREAAEQRAGYEHPATGIAPG